MIRFTWDHLVAPALAVRLRATEAMLAALVNAVSAPTKARAVGGQE
jgi:hypothetical protein